MALEEQAEGTGREEEEEEGDALALAEGDPGEDGDEDAPAGGEAEQADDEALGADAGERERIKNQKRRQKEALQSLRAQQNASLKAEQQQQRSTRMQFLLEQTEIFAHFLQGDADAALASASGKPRKGGGRSSSKAREEEEDKVMTAGADAYSSSHSIRLSAQPDCIQNGSMRDYQLAGLNWLLRLYDNGVNGILADEMGLGKTLQTVALLAYLHDYRGIKGPHMVVVPKSTLPNWLNEFAKWAPQLTVFKFHGNAEERAQQKDDYLKRAGTFNVLITTYEMVIKEKGTLKPWVWRYIVIDEAHRIKNVNSALSKVMRIFSSTNRLLLTGTPLQNNLNELWALLNFLLPEVFSSSEQFQEWFSSAEGAEQEETQEHVVKQLHKVLRPFLLRRLKSEVEQGLPPKRETVLKVGMSRMQKEYYKSLLQRDFEAINKGAEKSRLLNIVMQLRKCCNHPYLFQGAEPGPPFVTGEHLVENCGKTVLLDKLLPKIKNRGSKMLIFCQMTRMLDILEDYLLYRGYNYCRIDGSTAGEERETMIDDFNSDNSDKFIFLLSTRAGGLGINLAAADTVVLYDSDWNPQMDMQAIDRAHRIGQKSTVQIFRFCTENSVEEKVIQKAYKKLQLDALVIQQGRIQQQDQNKQVGKEDLLSMVRYGAEKIFDSTESSVTDEDVDAIIAKGEEETEALNEKMREFSEKAIQLSLQGDRVDDDYEPAPTNVSPEQQQGVAGERSSKQNAGLGGANERQRNISKSSEPKSKMPNLHDFQFYNLPRLRELYAKEDRRNYYEWQRSQEAREGQMLDDEPEEAPQPLTHAEQEERDRLLNEGFGNWSKREFINFYKACERHGRDNLEKVAEDMDTKSLEEVTQFADVFFRRYHEVSNGQKIMEQVEKGEQKIRRQQEQVDAIRQKLQQYNHPWRELRLQYGQNKGKSYTEEEDRFLLWAVDKVGFGNWDELKAEVRKSWLFRFDWYFKSRTPQELAKRVETLIRLVEREIHGETGGDDSKGKKRKADETMAEASNGKKAAMK
jgi:SWI/SNF-related matrix-associated actin-dependent regulator of chromatin subfamily A member 5